jgi:hypothetical protein
MPTRARTYWKVYRPSLVSLPIEIYNAVELREERSGIGKIDNAEIVKGYGVEPNE